MGELVAHITLPLDPGPLAVFEKRLLPEVRVTFGPELPDPSKYEVLVHGRPTEEEVSASPRLRALIIPYAGMHPKTRTLMQANSHVRVFAIHYNASSTAEMAVTLMLAAAKAVVPYDAMLRDGHWGRPEGVGPCILLDKKTAVVLGYGRIGRRIGQACKSLGMRVIAVNRSGDAERAPEADAIVPVSRLAEVLPRADMLLISLPGTPETLGLLGADELAKLPPNAVLVNVGRGHIVDEQPLYDALREQRIYGAGLDVWYRYPWDKFAGEREQPSALPFHELANVVMSPHRAGWSDETETIRVTALADALNAAARGETIPDEVDVAAGY